MEVKKLTFNTDQSAEEILDTLTKMGFPYPVTLTNGSHSIGVVIEAFGKKFNVYPGDSVQWYDNMIAIAQN